MHLARLLPLPLGVFRQLRRPARPADRHGAADRRGRGTGGAPTKTSSTMPVLLALAVSVGALACQPPAEEGGVPEAAVDTAAITATLDSMRSAFEDAVSAGDFEAQAAIYAPDAIYSHPGRPPVEGRDAIRSLLEEVTPPGATLEIEPMDFRVLGLDWLYEIGTGTFSFTPEGAEEAVQATSTYLVLFHRTEAGWLIQAEALSANEPPPASP